MMIDQPHGFVHADRVQCSAVRAIAHELGHGAFGWDDRTSEGNLMGPNLLPSCPGYRHLEKNQWDKIQQKGRLIP
jgi:hypothetical protein